jgi:hypothetical protein
MRMARFPVDRLRPRDGAITADIFANPSAQIAENLFWHLHIAFEPVMFAGAEEPSSLAARWFVLPIRDWRHLEGQVIAGDQGTLEGSFYVFGHDPASFTRLAFGHRSGRVFNVAVDMRVTLLGLDAASPSGGPSEQEARVRTRVSVAYRGLEIDRSHLAGLPENLARAEEMAARYADLSTY